MTSNPIRYLLLVTTDYTEKWCMKNNWQIHFERKSVSNKTDYSLSLSPDSWLDYENVHISGKARYTVDSLHAFRGYGIRWWSSSSISYTLTKADEDYQRSNSLCIIRLLLYPEVGFLLYRTRTFELSKLLVRR